MRLASGSQGLCFASLGKPEPLGGGQGRTAGIAPTCHQGRAELQVLVTECLEGPQSKARTAGMGEAFETLKTAVLHLLQRKHLVILKTGRVYPAGNESPTEGLGFRLPRPLGDVTSQHSLAPSWGGCSLAWPGSALGTEWQT